MDAVINNIGIDYDRPRIDEYTVIRRSRRILNCLGELCITVSYRRKQFCTAKKAVFDIIVSKENDVVHAVPSHSVEKVDRIHVNIVDEGFAS